MIPTTYRWRVIKDSPDPGPSRMEGKVLPSRMTEGNARRHEVATGRVLEKVVGSTTGIAA